MNFCFLFGEERKKRKEVFADFFRKEFFIVLKWFEPFAS